MHNIRIIIERHEDGYVGYPLGFTRGAIVGEGDTYSDAVKDTESAIEFFIEHMAKRNFSNILRQNRALLMRSLQRPESQYEISF